MGPYLPGASSLSQAWISFGFRANQQHNSNEETTWERDTVLAGTALLQLVRRNLCYAFGEVRACWHGNGRFRQLQQVFNPSGLDVPWHWRNSCSKFSCFLCNSSGAKRRSQMTEAFRNSVPPCHLQLVPEGSKDQGGTSDPCSEIVMTLLRALPFSLWFPASFQVRFVGGSGHSASFLAQTCWLRASAMCIFFTLDVAGRTYVKITPSFAALF